MLVNITEHFIESGREWQVGQNPDVPREVAAMWIADGKATADTDGVRDYQSPVSGGGIGGYIGPQLVTVTIGNSINSGGNASGTTRNNAAGADPTGWWQPFGEIHFSNALTGAPLTFPRITATTRADKWGQYAYSGQTLATINGDLPAQLFPALDTVGVKPDLVIGVALLENDIVQGATYAQCVARLNAWIYTIQGRYPSARIAIACPRPSYSYNTPAMVLLYQQLCAYTLSIDDGKTVFATKMNWYENPSAPANPLAGYTDASVHPLHAGASINARMGWVPLLNRVVTAARCAYRCSSTNFALTGSVAATGAGVSGTAATSMAFAGTANGTWAAVANDPSTTITVSQAAGAAYDIATCNFGSLAVSGFTKYSPYIKIRIDSGAENLRLLALQSRFSDGATNLFMNHTSLSSADSDPMAGTGYQNGDVLTLRYPPLIQADCGSAGAWTGIQNYMRPILKTAGVPTSLGGSAQFTVLDQGVGLVA